MCTISSFAFLHCLCAFRSREIYVGMKQVACIAVPRLTNPLSLIQESGFFHKHQGNQLLCNLLAAGGGLVAKSSLTLTTPWTVAYKAPRSMGFPRQEYWSGLPFPSRRDLPDSEIENTSVLKAVTSIASVSGYSFP